MYGDIMVNDNVFKGNGLAALLRSGSDKFGLVCKSCGSLNIELFGEDGIEGNDIGYEHGTNIIKCKDCGVTIKIYM